MMDDTRPPHVAFVVNSAFIDHHGTAPSESGRNSASNLASLPRARDQVTLHTFENSDGGKASISNLDWWSRRTPPEFFRERRWRTHPYALAFLRGALSLAPHGITKKCTREAADQGMGISPFLAFRPRPWHALCTSMDNAVRQSLLRGD